MKISQMVLNRNNIYRIVVGVIGVAINVLLALLTYYTDLPVYLDTIGTILVAALAGTLPGVAVAVFTNILCMIFNDAAAYFGIINVLIALITVFFVAKKPFKNKAANIICFVLTIALVSGILSAIIQWSIFGGPQHQSVMVLLKGLGAGEGASLPFFFALFSVIFNIFDKMVCLGIATLIAHFLPGEIKKRINNSVWRQRPLGDDEKRAIDNMSDKGSLSIKRRLVGVMLVMVFSTLIITSWIGIMRFFANMKIERTESAKNAARFAASVIDGSKVDEYIKYGEAYPGYNETERMLYNIRENALGVSYLYALKIGREGSTFVFDLDTMPEYEEYGAVDVEEGYNPGDFVPIEDAFKPYLDDLLAGREIPPIESNDVWNWVVSAYYPVLDEYGAVVCYVGADVSIDYLADFMGDFVYRIMLIMSGIIILIMVYGIWMSNYYSVYPIESIGVYVREFIKAGDNLESLDEVVGKFRSLEIDTNDEVEALYNDLVEMSVDNTEQIRSIKRLMESTAKMQDGLIITMADLVENRDSDTGAHIQKTAAYVEVITEGLLKKGYYKERITNQYISEVVRSAPLHDVGKINIPDNVLNKPGKLTDEEYEIMKTHTTAGRIILEKAIDTVGAGNYLKEARNMAGYHHERWDGKGYPEGLSGEVIPLSARIMAVADVFDALTSARVYKPPFSFDKAVSIIEEGKGTQFDPKCVEAFMDNLARVRAIYKKYSEA